MNDFWIIIDGTRHWVHEPTWPEQPESWQSFVNVSADSTDDSLTS